MPLNGAGPQVSFRTVIFATDLSVCSQNAGLYSALMAKYCSAELLIVHAFTLTQAALEVETSPPLVSQQRKNLEVLLSQKAAALSSDSITPVPLLLDGDPREVLLSLTEEYELSLLVLGTHGEGWVKRKLLGSVAEKVLRSTRHPTLTVGPHVSPATTKESPFRRILLATDLTGAVAKAGAIAVSFAHAVGAEIDVLNVIEDGAAGDAEKLKEITRHLYDALHAVVPEAAKDFCNSGTFIEAGNAYEQILQHIRERSIDLLVLGIQKASYLGLKRKTSEAFRLIREAECPVLTVPDDK
jgi:nucleotide-binding universal stress UspA family protein